MRKLSEIQDKRVYFKRKLATVPDADILSAFLRASSAPGPENLRECNGTIAAGQLQLYPPYGIRLFLYFIYFVLNL